MLKLAFAVPWRIAAKRPILGVAALCLSACAAAPGACAQTPATTKIPDLASINFAWLAFGVH